MINIKKQIFLLMLTLFIGGLFLFMTNYYNKDRKEVRNIQIKSQKSILQDISSNMDSIEEPELDYSVLETELYNKNQMFFNNIEYLYKYLSFGQVEQIKERIQFYVHQYINPDINYAVIDYNSIFFVDNKVSFKVIFETENTRDLDVEVTIKNDNKLININLFDNLYKT